MKKIKTYIKLNIQAGKANPAPPIGPALGQHGLPIMEFCKEYNEKTKRMGDSIVPVVITVFEDRTFSFVTKTPPASDLLRKAAGIQKGSGVPNKTKVGKVTKAQVAEIAEKKMQDLNARDAGSAAKIIAGTARSIGIEIV
ncbi:50S ribosomal protein L11 [candidate division WWE3 bacterium CG08_land_8_20_14_0_20_40_13]|uniref:Large ribosomal subunit protein uL11 n=1 Tax=candidate division WWE3 bacterium CG08_land_8_20_14_0_20_40_13 TaxID=1975084 RepID=A0A2H0XDE4_UNCKA|nr:MAG: 50S ribosomal protein L11 [candidate division WWE3 bacterium CG08_land_8_20_14_0_20_40_13]